MGTTRDENIKNYGSLCKQGSWNCLLPFEHEVTCISCGYNVIKR